MFEQKPRRHELLSVFMLSIGTACMFLGYNVQSMIAESVLHSVSSKDSDRISPYAGYYGAAVHYISFGLCAPFTASLQYYLSSKSMLILSSSLFSVYYFGYIYISNYFFYAAQALLGFGFAVYSSAEGTYLSEHSSRRTIDSNTALETGIGHSSLLLSGITLFIIYTFVPHTYDGLFFSFGEQSILLIYGALFVTTVVSVIIYCFLPTQQFDSIALNSNRITPDLKTQFKRFYDATRKPNALLSMVAFSYMGCMVSFVYGICPTALSFSSTSSTDVFSVPIYLLCSGVAPFLGAFTFRPLIKRLHQFKLLVPMFVHLISMSASLVILYLSFPNQATVRPTTEAVILPPGRVVIGVLGFLLGMCDFTMTMCRTVVSQVAVPEYRAEMFSLTRIYQCISSCIILFASPHLTLFGWLLVLSVGLFIGLVALFVIVKRTHDESSMAPILPLRDDKEIAKEFGDSERV